MRDCRWAKSDAVLVPRGESEEETLVGSFTKLLVSHPAHPKLSLFELFDCVIVLYTAVFLSFFAIL